MANTKLVLPPPENSCCWWLAAPFNHNHTTPIMDKLENEIKLKQSVLEAAERLQTTMYDRQTFPMMNDQRNLLKNQLDSMYPIESRNIWNQIK